MQFAVSRREEILERVHHGPGYRLYFTRWGAEIVILLAGGDKSTQHKDIERALALARQLMENGR